MVNRRLIIEKHSPRYTAINRSAPLSVGNGKFCFTADFTGLQTFFDEYAQKSDAFPLCTMAEWGWHSYPLNAGEESALRLTPFDTYGRTVYYACDNTGQEELFKKIRHNAHKFHLGKIGFTYSGKTLPMDKCKLVSQYLSLWEGILFSQFLVDGEKVETETFVHPEQDTLYVRVSLSSSDRLNVTIHFPYASHKKSAADFSLPERHITRYTGNFIERELDDTSYKVSVNGQGIIISGNEKQHTVLIQPQSEKFDFSVRFFQSENDHDMSRPMDTSHPMDAYEEARSQCRAFWEHYWNSGGFIDFSGSADPRATELERRVVLSQYVIAIQSRGQLPPAETGLCCNSWYGKFHLEMFFWHHAHFALWGRTQYLTRTLAYYKKILPVAREIAASQGYKGARWPKMCDPSGKNTPSSVAVFLIWQQPHPIMLAELCYRADASFLREYCEIVIETADFMASFVQWEENRDRYVLGPPYIPAQERHDPTLVLNAAYELEYFRWGLKKADEWLERLGEPGRYGAIADKISLPSHKDGVYLAHENCPDTFSRHPFFTDHPSMLAMYGVLNSEKIDPKLMSATLDKVLSLWDMDSLYGWDFPMMAMTACRLGRYRDAVDILCMESVKNTYMENGHNRMKGDDALPLYLPGNGGLLLAVAMMAAGYGDKKGSSFPEGFTVTSEGIYAYI